MRKTARVAFVLLVAACLATACKAQGGTPEAETSSEPVKVGAVLSLTGTYAALGTAEKNALELEVARINADGGIGGRQIEILIEDDGTDEAKAVAAAAKLVGQEGVVAVLGASGTGQTMAMRAEVERAGVPQISMAGGSAVTAEVSPQVFQTPWPNKIVVPFVLKAMKAKGMKRIGLISDSGGYGKDGRTVILNEASALGLEIVSDQTFNAGDTDMTPQLTSIRDSGADCILLWTAGKEAAIVVKNRESLKLALPVYGGSGLARKEFVDGAGTAGEGVLLGTGKAFAQGYAEGSDNRTAVDDFTTRFEAKYGLAPDIFAGHAFDAIHLVVDAARRLPADFTPAQLRDEIERTSGFVGYDGTFSFSPTDHNGLTEADLQMYRVANGAWQLEK